MIYSGKIIDGNGAPIKGASLLFVTDTGEPVVRLSADAAGLYKLDTNFDGGLLNPGINIRFEAPGYGWYGISAPTLPQSFTVTLNKKITTFPAWMVAAVLGALLVYSQRGKKKVGKLNSEDLKMIFQLTGGIIGLVILKQILEMLGFWKDKGDKQLDAEASNPSSPWNPNFWQAGNPYATPPFSEVSALTIANNIYSEIGTFWDNEDKVIAAIHTLKTKAEVSFVAWKFKQAYNRDLLTYLREGPGSMPWHGLSSADVSALNDYVKRLPNY